MNDNDAKKLEFIFSYANYVLKEYLYKKFDIDLSLVCKIPAKNPEIIVEHRNKKYALSLNVVDKDYRLDFDVIIGNETDEDEKKKINDDLIRHCTFLVNAVNSAFNFYKRTLKTSKDSEEYFLVYISMGIDENTNLYIDDEDEYRIGIVINEL